MLGCNSCELSFVTGCNSCELNFVTGCLDVIVVSRALLLDACM